MKEILNRRGRFDYEILETFEAGIELRGSEVKSIRLGNANLKDAYAVEKNGELMLLNCHIDPYKFSSHSTPEPTRTRKLLLHKSEIKKLAGQSQQKGLTLIPLKMYLKGQWVKVTIGLGKAKNLRNKKETKKNKDLDRDMEREILGRD